jgi:hypothetical protein
MPRVLVCTKYTRNHLCTKCAESDLPVVVSVAG